MCVGVHSTAQLCHCVASATTLPEILREMIDATSSERQGRLIDQDEEASMEAKKREGYF